MSDNDLNRRATLALALGAGATTLLAADPADANQPRMEAALRLLRSAKYELEHGARNKGGHRIEAIRHVEAAIRQVKLGIRVGNG